jgi:hypothetical protein
MKCELRKIDHGKFLLMILALALSDHFARAQTELPDNIAQYCPADFAKWIKPIESPDNLSFDESDACNFYRRAEEMFLWLTSPVLFKQRQGSYVFNSPLFYRAWSADADRRSLAPITRDEIARGEIMLDVTIDIEPGQAGKDSPVLMTQDDRLVYYLVEVNDVYAYFLTGKKTDEIKPAPTHFPTTQPELDNITKFASNHRKKLADAKTLAVELKSAWIDAAAFKKSELDNYVTMEATIQIYGPSPSSPTTTLIPQGSPKKRQLALVGMHVVFSAKGHKEMLWATFEHVSNTRNPGYRYFAKDILPPQDEPADATGNWVFSTNSDIGTFNDTRMHLDKATGNILAYNGKTIGPSNILRESPWGTWRPGDSTTNTRIISINKQAHDLLLTHRDVRKNYIMIGATWTANGQPPDQGNQLGATSLVNTTMETFYNNRAGNPNGVSNCFNCHTGINMLGNKERTGLSHIFGVLQPLDCPPGGLCSSPRLVGGKK